MANLNNIVSNSGEDFVDELTSLLVTKHSNDVFKPILSKLDKDDATEVEQALHGSLQALQFGIMNAVIMYVTTFVITKSGLLLTGILLWLKGTHALKQTRNISNKLFNTIAKKGVFKVISRVSGILLGNQNQTLAMAKMTNDTGNNIMSVISNERTNQTLMHSANQKRVDKNIDRAYGSRNQSRMSYIEQHKILKETGGYTTSKKHKLVFEKATGQDLKATGVLWNQSFINKLNSYTEFAKTAEGTIINNATAQLNYMASQGWDAKKNV